MSVSWGTQYSKLKTNLRLAANRLRLLQKKKTEMALKARTEIADFLAHDKEDRARIRVESIIREDFVVEAYELLEMYCELLLARFGIIQQMKEVDDGIAEAVSSLLWVAPRIGHEVVEFKVISDQLTQKYGKQYAEAARMNQLPEPSRVSPKLIQKLSVSAPSKILVEKYLIEIAKSAGIVFRADEKVLRDDDDEIAAAERNLINFMKEGEAVGWNVGPDGKNQPPPGGPPAYPGPPPGPPGGPGFGGHSGGGGGGGGGGGMAAFNYPPPQHAAPPPPQQYPQQPPQQHPQQPPQQHPQQPPPAGMYPSPNLPLPPEYAEPAPNVAEKAAFNDYPDYTLPKNPAPGSATAPQHDDDPDHIYEIPPGEEDLDLMFPEPPKDFAPRAPGNHPSGGGGSGGGNTSGGGGGGGPSDLNFDDLAKRFDQLKKRL